VVHFWQSHYDRTYLAAKRFVSTETSSPRDKINEDRVTRSDIIRAIAGTDVFDILVIGGGIHGAATAKISAALGFKTTLIDQGDYASATSSRSSKMAHGGLRYLELFDFQQVFEGIRAREEMFDNIGHIVKPAEFLIPVPRNSWFFRVKLGIGLCLYDILVNKASRRHRWVPRRKLAFPGVDSGRKDLMGCFVYTDGIMSDTRLVIENILAARRYGGLCLNYCEAKSMKRNERGISEVITFDRLGNREIPIRARLVINCAGPWASLLAMRLGARPKPIRFSRGSHIIFNKPWVGPSLFLPMPGKARYYFVWPHPAGTMVGTTEREVNELEPDPLPSQDEIEEILGRIERDIPGAGLSRENACYAFAGIRTLPLRDKGAKSSVLSRKHIWSHEDDVLTLVGGKYTTASWTALEGVKMAARLLNAPVSKQVIEAREDLKKLPSSMTPSEEAAIGDALFDLKIDQETRSRLITRYGKRLTSDYLQGLSPDPDKVIAMEAKIALETEQVESLEDLMRRRLELEYEEGHGEVYLPVIREVFRTVRPEIDFDRESSLYLARMARISKLLGRS